ncbi:MAG: dihydrofolate reductase family protein [Chitinophagales bacterium]|nr:dihydrofolate reductase family protein [Chitinophagales bacterium]
MTEPVDCIVLGRKLAEGFIPHWAANTELEGAEKFNTVHKVVFTKTLDSSIWENTILANGNIADEIDQLKKQDGKDIIAYGGAQFVSSLIKHDLINEYHLFINPAVLVNGMRIFNNVRESKKLFLVKACSFKCGIVVLHYISVPAK